MLAVGHTAGDLQVAGKNLLVVIVRLTVVFVCKHSKHAV